MPTPLHKEIRWHMEEVHLCKKMIAEVEADSADGDAKADLLKRLRETLAVHEQSLAELENKRAQRT